MNYKTANALIESQRRAQVPVHHTFPVMQILLPERNVEAISMPSGRNVGDGRAFTKHLQNGIARDKMDQQEDHRDHQPEDRQGVQQSGK